MISVIMPAYNASSFIGEAIESILNQTYKDFEFLIVDDGSTDGTLDIIQQYAEQDSRIRVFENNHGGANKARNTAIEAAKYAWIACLDADDVALPNRLERQIEEAQKDPEVIIWGTYIYQINLDGKKLGTIENGPTSKEAFYEVDRTKSAVQITQPTAMFKREIAQLVGGYDERVKGGQEIELWDRMVEHGPAVVIPEHLLLYRLHNQSISAKRFFDQQLVYEFILERNKARQRGEMLDLEVFQQQHRSKPIWVRFFRFIHYKGRYYYRNTGVLLSEKRFFMAILSLSGAMLFAPRFTIKRIIGRLQRRSSMT